LKYDPIAYTYDADFHCPECAEKRFGFDKSGFITGTDSEGNEVGVVAPWDEWADLSYSEAQTLDCATCQKNIETCLADCGNECDRTTVWSQCVECDRKLCFCETTYGHDCE
jgi:hypothetical protein